jgi:hypothetical protein
MIGDADASPFAVAESRIHFAVPIRQFVGAETRGLALPTKEIEDLVFGSLSDQVHPASRYRFDSASCRMPLDKPRAFFKDATRPTTGHVVSAAFLFGLFLDFSGFHPTGSAGTPGVRRCCRQNENVVATLAALPEFGRTKGT